MRISDWSSDVCSSDLIALYRLAVLLGRAPQDYPANLVDCASIPSLDRPIPAGDGAALIRRRPDVRQAERRLAAATARIGVETAALYPTVSLGASAGTTSRTIEGLEIGRASCRERVCQYV